MSHAESSSSGTERSYDYSPLRNTIDEDSSKVLLGHNTKRQKLDAGFAVPDWLKASISGRPLGLEPASKSTSNENDSIPIQTQSRDISNITAETHGIAQSRGKHKISEAIELASEPRARDVAVGIREENKDDKIFLNLFDCKLKKLKNWKPYREADGYRQLQFLRQVEVEVRQTMAAKDFEPPVITSAAPPKSKFKDDGLCFVIDPVRHSLSHPFGTGLEVFAHKVIAGAYRRRRISEGLRGFPLFKREEAESSIKSEPDLSFLKEEKLLASISEFVLKAAMQKAINAEIGSLDG